MFLYPSRQTGWYGSVKGNCIFFFFFFVTVSVKSCVLEKEYVHLLLVLDSFVWNRLGKGTSFLTNQALLHRLALVQMLGNLSEH